MIKVIKNILAIAVIAVIFFAPSTVTANNSAGFSLADVTDLINYSEQSSLAVSLSSTLCKLNIKTIHVTHDQKIKTNFVNSAIAQTMQCDSPPAIVLL